jgi:hypothetical protein
MDVKHVSGSFAGDAMMEDKTQNKLARCDTHTHTHIQNSPPLRYINGIEYLFFARVGFYTSATPSSKAQFYAS